MNAAPEPPPTRLARLPRAAQGVLLLILSVALVGGLELARLPAALLVGPMLAGVVAGVNGASVRLPRPAFAAAQAVVGCLVAASISPSLFTTLYDRWWLVGAAVFTTIAASTLMGWLISSRNILPGTTAVWGSTPGAATAMVLMAESFGADARLVAFMQYLRVIFVAAAAALVARLFVDTSGVAAAPVAWFPPLDPVALPSTLAVALLGGALGRLLRLPSAFFLGAMLLGCAATLGFGLRLQLPEWLLAFSYAAIGWTIGLSFTPDIVRHALRAAPQVAASILVLLMVCAGVAWTLHRLLGIDPLTAYLATSPGGLDSIAIIAAASKSVDLSFVLALQTARFLIVLILGPSLAKLVARLVARPAA